ncbi:MAG: hypothetical protein ACYDAR_11755 [Thermomicrobiales bacterium]
MEESTELWGLDRAIEQITEIYVQSYIQSGGPSPHMDVIVGINNSNRTLMGDDLTHHAQQWVMMLDRINSYFDSQGWTPTFRAEGGSDSETDFNTPALTRQWLDQFSLTGISWLVYNYGNATCPGVGDGTVNQHCYTTVQQSWTQEDIWYISYGQRSALAFPEVYNLGFAQEWYQISLYGLVSKSGHFIAFSGTLTTLAACVGHTDPNDPATYDPVCPGTNDPKTGWTQLSNQLSNGPQFTQISIRFSSDIYGG